jgi:hypothetical protein
LQNPYSTAGSGEYHVNVSFASKLTWDGGAAVAAMWWPVKRRQRPQ